MNAGLKVAFLLTALAAGGCSSYSAPSLKVTSAVATRSATGTVIDFTVDASNRNEVELPLREVRYSVSLDGREVFRGVRSPEASLRRLGVQTLHIPAVVPPELSPGAGARYTIEGQLGYTTPGSFAQVLFDIKVRRPTVAFRQEGEVMVAPPAP